MLKNAVCGEKQSERVLFLWYHGYVEQRVVRGRVHVRVHQDGRVLEGDRLAAAAPLVRALLRVVHLQQEAGIETLFLFEWAILFYFLINGV